MAIVLGIEVGASKTIAVGLDLTTREVLGRGVAEAGQWTAHGDRPKARAELLKAIAACLTMCNSSYVDVAGVCIGTAGVDLPEDVAALTDAVKEELSAEAGVQVYSDAVTALASGTGGVLHGCVLISGTGTVAFGMVNGRMQARASGWGPAFMDGGSGYDIGSRALGALSKSHDGRGAETVLVDALTSHLGVQKPEDLIRWAYAEQGWARIAALAPIVISCASQGDPVADTILKHGVGELYHAVKAVVTKLGLDKDGQPFRLVLAGGLLTEGCLYTHYLWEVLKENIPSAAICYPAVEPAEAAAWLAYNHTQRQ